MFLVSSVEWVKIWSLLQSTDWTLLVFVFLLSSALVGLSAFKWRLLLIMHKVFISLGTALRLYWIGSFFSNFLPSSIGGDTMRLALLRNIHDLATVAATIVEERATGFLILVGLSAGALYFGPVYPPYLAVPLWTGVMLAAGLLLALVFLPTQSIPVSFKGLVERLPGFLSRLINAFTRVARATTTLLHAPSSLVTTLILSIVFYIGVFIVQYLVFKACSIPVSALDVLRIAPLTLLVGALPISLNGIGIIEGAFVILYGYVGITPEQALTAALLNRFIQLGVSLLGAPFWIVYKKPLRSANIASLPDAPTARSPGLATYTQHNHSDDT